MAARRRARGTRGPRNLVWTVVLNDNEQVLAAGTSSNEICVASDWTAADGFERATLLGIRGWISVARDDGSAFEGNFMGLIGKFNAGETKPLPRVPATYEDEDILWTMGGNMMINDNGGRNGQPGAYFEVNVKSRRKIDVNTVISFEYQNGLGGTRLSMVLRALIDKG